MLPVIFYFLIKFTEDPKLMGEHVSGKFTKFFIRLAAFVIFVAVVVTLGGKILGIK
jgi:Mn2+/Fe2+ NRAMP family transporter